MAEVLPMLPPDSSGDGEATPSAGASAYDDNSEYFARWEPERAAAYISQRRRTLMQAQQAIRQRCSKNWLTYYGLDGGKAGWSDDLYPEGEQGERVRLRSNVIRNLWQHVLVNTCSVKPTIQPMAKNTDSEAIRQVQLGRSVGEDLMKRRRGFDVVDQATEYAGPMDSGYVHGRWNKFGGGVYWPGSDGTTFRGLTKYAVHTPLDVLFDWSTQSWEDKSDLIVNDRANRHDLAATYPDQADRILGAARWPAVSEMADATWLPHPTRSGGSADASYESEEIEVCWYYHRRSPSMPEGRCLVFLPDGTWLDDGPLQYADIPVWKVQCGRVIGTALGYGPFTSGASMQEALNKLLSTVATTLFTHGVSNIAVVKGTNIDVNDLPGGQKVFELDPVGTLGIDQLIKPINLTQLPKEVMEAVKSIIALMEQEFGVNRITRGDPGSVTAGVSLALFQAMAQQFSGPLEESRAALIESMVLFEFEALRLHSESMPRLVQLVGKSKRQALKEFYGKDLGGIERVTIDLGNPLARTPAGKVQIAQVLREAGLQLTAQMLLQVLNTGNLDFATDADMNEADLIAQENDMLRDGVLPTVIAGQTHWLHIKQQMAVLHDPDIVMDKSVFPCGCGGMPEPDGQPCQYCAGTGQQTKLQRVQEHLNQHLQLHEQGDLLQMVASQDPRVPPGYGNPAFQPAPGAPPAAPAHGKPAGKPSHGLDAPALRPPPDASTSLSKPLQNPHAPMSQAPIAPAAA